MNRKLDVIRLMITVFITMVLMATSTITIYGLVAKPEFYSHFMNTGNKYLEGGMYEEAILEFEKAIKIEEKSTQARVGAAKGNIKIGNIDKAVEWLKEAQRIDMENRELLLEMIDLLKDEDPDAAYELLMNYVSAKGEDNIDDEIKELLESAEEEPQIPEFTPPSGTYIKPFNLKITSDKARLGHALYYTYGDAYPDKNAQRYRGGIKIEDSVHINFIGYNPEGKSTEVFVVDYVIDTSVEEKLLEIIETSLTELENTEEGTEVGNCTEGSKEKFQPIIEKGTELLKQEIISADDANKAWKDINDALYEFRQSIIKPTDKSALLSEIAKAESLVANAVEGDEVGQYRSGSKSALNNAIAAAKQVNDNLLATQEQIDAAKNTLTAAINSFNSKKLTEMDVIIAETGANVGPVTVSLLWNTTDDLDLYVTSPKGDTVYYANSNSSSGGVLDVDRQVSTFVENPVENVYWDNPPSGTYTVKVKVYSKRSSGDIPLRVRVIINGSARVYDMSVSDGTTTVCTFNY